MTRLAVIGCRHLGEGDDASLSLSILGMSLLRDRETANLRVLLERGSAASRSAPDITARFSPPTRASSSSNDRVAANFRPARSAATASSCSLSFSLPLFLSLAWDFAGIS